MKSKFFTRILQCSILLFQIDIFSKKMIVSIGHFRNVLLRDFVLSSRTFLNQINLIQSLELLKATKKVKLIFT